MGEIRLEFADTREACEALGYRLTGNYRVPVAGDLFWNGVAVWERKSGYGGREWEILQRVTPSISPISHDAIERAHANPIYDI